MTAEERAFYDKYFTRYGSPSESCYRQIYFHVNGMDIIESPEDVVRADKSAAAYIQEFENYIKFLQLYRQELAARYNHLVTDPTQSVVKLIRERRDNKVIYWLRFYLRYMETGKEVLQSFQRFEGKQRHEAIKAYDDYIAAHPDTIAEKDIEKRQWER